MVVWNTNNYLNAQINIFGEAQLGISIQNKKKALFPTQTIFCYDAGISYVTGRNLIFSLEYQRSFFSDKTISIKNVSSHSMLPGLVYSMHVNQKKLDVLGYLSYSRVSFYNDHSFSTIKYEFNAKSLWSQWGFNIAATYYFKPWFGASLNYSRFCARRYDPGNYQSFISLGVVMKWSHKPKATV